VRGKFPTETFGLIFGFLVFFAASVSAADINITLIEKQDSLRKEVETKIKENILDPIFGPSKAFVFADITLELISKKAEQGKEGLGLLQQYKEKMGNRGQADTDFLLPGIPKPKSILGQDSKRPEAAHGSQTTQSAAAEQIRYGVETEITAFQVTVIHDEALSKEMLALARERVDDFLLPYKIKKIDPPIVLFKPTRFKSYNIWDDLKKPSVYLPLLYAILFLLLLMFLFGPLWGFFRKYIKALMAKPGAEVNIEDKREEGGGEGGEGGEEKQEGHQQIDMNLSQEGEEEEDESMKKFEPFTYINEGNLKKLIYLFLIRKEDPWVIAIVLSYLAPELSRQILSMLPVEAQSRVALEALSVRQATREQIAAIDKDIKESVDFVMGGIERMSKMLEDADPQTRRNIIEYLKTQKPEIYEKIRQLILSFEDIASFSDRDVQVIIRSVSNEDIARVVKNADPAISEKFFKNMSAGAANTIKEIMEYSAEINLQQVDDSQTRILDTIKSLEAEGKIASYRRGNQGIYIVDVSDVSRDEERKKRFEKISGKEEKKEESPDSGQYFEAALGFFNQNNFEQAVSYLEYVVGLSPSDSAAWQYLGSAYYSLGRTDDSVAAYEKYVSLSEDPEAVKWLENFKAQLGK